MSIDHADHPNYVPPITFAELCAAGRTAVPAPGSGDDPFGPLADDPVVEHPLVPDSLEAFVDAWGTAGQSPADAPFPPA